MCSILSTALNLILDTHMKDLRSFQSTPSTLLLDVRTSLSLVQVLKRCADDLRQFKSMPSSSSLSVCSLCF
jgi:hypothetical protein